MVTPKQFLQELFGSLIEEGKFIEIRDILNKKIVGWHFYRTFDDVISYVAKGDVYFGVCPREGLAEGKEEHIKTITALFVDFDHMSIDQVMDNLKIIEFNPSIIVDSGHGFHVYWLLREPEQVQANTKGVLKGLVETLGADHCYDLSRVLRVPGTKNVKVPNDHKVVKVILFKPEHRYNLSDFDAYEVEIQAGGEAQANFTGSMQDVDLEVLTLAPAIKKLIQEGKPKGERSEADFKVVLALGRAGYLDDTILGVFEKYPIGEKYREQGIGYLKHTIGKARQKITADVTYEMPNIEATRVLAKAENVPSAFTLDLLPDGLLKDYAIFAYPQTEASMQYHMAVGLVMAATLLGRNIYLEEGASTFYPNLYILVIGASGISRKSTAIKLVNKFISMVEPDLILGTTMSLEGMLEAFRSNNCKLIVYDELRHLMDNEAKSYGAGLISFFTSIWDSPATHRIEIKSLADDEKTIHNPILNIIAASTPDWLQVTEIDIRGGFLGRFLPMQSGNERRRLAIRQPMNETALRALMERFAALTHINHQYTWSDDAVAPFEKYYNQLHDEAERLPNIANIMPFWSRIDTHIRKLAMIFDACSTAPTYQITLQNLEYAIKFMGEVTKFNKVMLDRITFSRSEQLEQRFCDILKGHPDGVDHSKVLRDIHLSADEMRKVVQSLLEKDRIEAYEIKVPKAKKPTTMYKLTRLD